MCSPMCSLQRLGCQISMQTAAPTTINSPPGSTSKKSRKLSGIAIRPRPAIGTVRWRVDNSRPNICTWLDSARQAAAADFVRRPVARRRPSKLSTPTASRGSRTQAVLWQGRTRSIRHQQVSSTISAGSERRYRSSSDRVHSPKQRASCSELSCVGLSRLGLFSEEVSAIKFFCRAGKPNWLVTFLRGSEMGT